MFLDDHFFHFKYAYLIRTQGWDVVKNFKWISVGAGRSGVYQLTLYNLAMIPFTYFKDMILGLKISDIFWVSLSMSVIYYSFRRFKIRYPMLLILVLASLSYFMDRMLIGRALVLVPGLVMLELYFATEKKYAKFFFVSLLHVAWHTSTFFLPLTIAVLAEAARILAGQKFFWKNIAAAVGGFFVGINLTLYTIAALIAGTIGVQFATTQLDGNISPRVEGAELYPVDMFKMLSHSEITLLFLFVCMAVVFCYYMIAKKRETKEGRPSEKSSNFVLYAAFLFALMSFAGSIIMSGRFYDFYFVSVIFLLGIILTRIFEEKKVVMEPYLKSYVLVGVVAFFMFATVGSFLDRKQAIARTDYRPIGEVAAWIEGKSNENDRIFLSDWGYFAVAFFYNSKNIYTMGMEPRSAIVENPVLYWKWYNIFAYGIYCDKQEDCVAQNTEFNEKIEKAGSDEEKQAIQKENSKKIIESIRNDFKAKYLIVSGGFASIIELNPELINDSATVQSGYNGSMIIKGFELK
jgi:hypothetical protein